MPKDGTQIVNPNGKTMYLVLSGRRGSGAERSQTKVSSIKEASERTVAWFIEQHIYRSDVKSSHVHVGGMVVAKVGTDGKVYRVDPFTQAVYSVDKPDRVLYDPVAYQAEIEKEELQREHRASLRKGRDAALVAFLKRVFDDVFLVAGDEPTLANKDELLVFNARYLTPDRPDPGLVHQGFKFRFERRLSNAATASISIGINIAGFSREDRYETHFKVESGMSSGNAVNQIPALDEALEFYTNCRGILNVLKASLESEPVKAAFAAYNAARVELEKQF